MLNKVYIHNIVTYKYIALKRRIAIYIIKAYFLTLQVLPKFLKRAMILKLGGQGLGGMEYMKNTLYVKTLAVAIAVAFLFMAGNGLGNSGQSDGTFEAANITDILRGNSLDTVKISDKLDTVPNLAPPIGEPQSIQFDESFEDDILGNVSDDPPWLTTESTSTSYGNWGSDGFEFDVVGQNPNANWTTVDGSTVKADWGVQDFEAYAPPGTPIPADAFAGSYGQFYNIGGTLVSSATVGTPPGTVMSGSLTPGALSADLTGGAAASYFGPASDFGSSTTEGYLGGWFNMKQLTANYVVQIMAYDLDAAGGLGDSAVVAAFYPSGTPLAGRYAHWPGGGGVLITGPTWTANTWHEVFIHYNVGTQTYSLWIDGTEYVAGSAFNAVCTKVDGFIVYATANTGVRVDNMMVGHPPAGGAHVVDVSNAWSFSGSGGAQSVYLDQNNYAGEQASVSTKFPSPYAFGEFAGVSWAVRTSNTVANTNGATFLIQDYNDRTLMGVRFSGGQIQYNNGGTWTNLMPFAANTEYWFDMYMNCLTKTYMGIDIDFVPYLAGGENLVNRGAGVAGLRVEGTVSTQSEIYFDDVERWGDLQDGSVRITQDDAHSGIQSVRMWEGGGDTACDMGAYMGGDLAKYGEFWFWFYGDGTLGGGSIYLLDTTQTFIITIISIGSDLTAANIPHPGEISWIDGNGAGGGWVVDGPTFTEGAWNNISIKYDIGAGTYEAFWNGVSQGTYGIMESGALDAGIVFFFGEGPAAPTDWYFDDIGLWVDDIPATPQNLRVYMPPPIPSTENWYTVDQDNAVQGTVTNTYTNVDEITPLDGLTEDILEFLPAGGSGDTYPNAIDPTDTTTEAITEIQTDNAAGASPSVVVVGDGWYTVDKGFIMFMDGFDISAFSGLVTAATLEVQFSVEAGYAGVNAVQWALDGGVLATTGIVPIDGNVDRIATYNLFAQGVDTLAEINTLDIAYTNDDPGGPDAVSFDYVKISITTSGTYSLEHRWRTVNVPAGADAMKLQITARTSAAADDSFTFGYSTVLGGPYTGVLTVNSATMANYEVAIPTSLTGQFYINVVDDNTGDAVQQDSIIVDAITIYWQQVIGMTTATEVATADNPNLGTVVGTFALTVPPADATAQQITEVAGGGSATLLTEGFEGGVVPPAGWMEIDQDGDGNDWMVATAPGQSAQAGTYSAMSESWNGVPFTPDNYLITPLIDMSAWSGGTLTWWDATQDPAWPSEHYLVKVSTTGTAVGDFTATISDITLTTDAWTLRTASLDAFGGQQIYIAWEHCLCTDWYQMKIDTVQVDVSAAGNYINHVWTMENMPANSLSRTLSVTARTSAGADDTFNIGWSKNPLGPFTPVISVNTAAYQTYTFGMNPDYAGPMYIRATDANPADTTADTLFIDALWIDDLISPVNTTVNVLWDLSTDDGGGQNDVTQYNVYFSDAATAGTELGPFNYLDSVPAGTNVYRHYGEASDFVDNIWYIVTAEDSYSESWSTGRATKFNVAPDAQNVLVNGATFVDVDAGTFVTLTADIYDDSSTWEDVLKMDGAEWYADADPGEGLGNPLTGDGLFDTTLESFMTSVDTTGWTAGTHQIYVRGHEYGPGNTGTGWGPVSIAVLINITVPIPYDIDLTGRVAGDWAFVSFPIAISGNIETILDDPATDWDVAKWFDGSSQRWMTYRKGATTNTFTNIDNQMGVWVHLTIVVGDKLTTGLGGNFPASQVQINLYAGWNMVGYPSQTPMAANLALAGTGATIISVYIPATPYIQDFTDLSLVTMDNGNAYWVFVPAGITWDVPFP